MIIKVAFLLLVAHAVADFALQPDSMAKGKNRHRKPENIPPGQKIMSCWPYWLSAHALINGGMVYLATGRVSMGIIETVAHWAIDFIKCENLTNPHADQLLHLSLKAGFLLALILGS